MAFARQGALRGRCAAEKALPWPWPVSGSRELASGVSSLPRAYLPWQPSSAFTAWSLGLRCEIPRDWPQPSVFSSPPVLFRRASLHRRFDCRFCAPQSSYLRVRAIKFVRDCRTAPRPNGTTSLPSFSGTPFVNNQ